MRTWSAFQLHPLTGFSHGAAGIAYALLRLAQVTGDQIWKDAAEEAVAFEQSLFLPEIGNWPDLRNLSEYVDTDAHAGLTCGTAWCHGATGIGLARLLATLPRRAYNPGFFQGMAGIGYELLRVAYPDQVPSVLLWE